jgi:adenylosuccinate lyase
MVQLHRMVDELITAMRRIEGQMADLALRHRATPMIGRTLGRHALPITFGYKVATWLTAQRADIERLLSWQARFASGVLSGAVGTHAVMGAAGRRVEDVMQRLGLGRPQIVDSKGRRVEDVMQRLGLGRPQIVDSKGRTDVFADFAAALAIAARNQAHVAQEVFLLQGYDIREVSLASTAIGSSTMPHKSNPTACIEVMSRAREVAAALPVMLEWILIIHERDTAQHGALLEEMCIDMGQIVSCTEGMFAQLVVHPDHMRHNLGRTRGAILTEGVTADLALTMGRRSAHHLMREISARMAEEGRSLAEVMAMDERTAHVAVPHEDEAYGLAPQMVDDCLRDLRLLPG